MKIYIEEETWNAEILLFPQEPLSDYINLTAYVRGHTQETSLEGARRILNLFAEGRFACIRVLPEGVSEIDFDTKETEHRAYVRFTFRLGTGEWCYPKSEGSISLTELTNGSS